MPERVQGHQVLLLFPDNCLQFQNLSSLKTHDFWRLCRRSNGKAASDKRRTKKRWSSDPYYHAMKHCVTSKKPEWRQEYTSPTYIAMVSLTNLLVPTTEESHKDSGT